VRLLDSLTDSLSAWVHLYVNPVQLSLDTVLADFLEASFPLYAPQQVKRWFAATWIGDRAQAFGDTVAWTRGIPFGPQTVYGVYLTAGQLGPLLYAEPSPFGPIPVDHAGQVLDYTPRLTMKGSCDEVIASMRAALAGRSQVI